MAAAIVTAVVAAAIVAAVVAAAIVTAVVAAAIVAAIVAAAIVTAVVAAAIVTAVVAIVIVVAAGVAIVVVVAVAVVIIFAALIGRLAITCSAVIVVAIAGVASFVAARIAHNGSVTKGVCAGDTALPAMLVAVNVCAGHCFCAGEAQRMANSLPVLAMGVGVADDLRIGDTTLPVMPILMLVAVNACVGHCSRAADDLRAGNSAAIVGLTGVLLTGRGHIAVMAAENIGVFYSFRRFLTGLLQ